MLQRINTAAQLETNQSDPQKLVIDKRAKDIQVKKKRLQSAKGYREPLKNQIREPIDITVEGNSATVLSGVTKDSSNIGQLVSGVRVKSHLSNHLKDGPIRNFSGQLGASNQNSIQNSRYVNKTFNAQSGRDMSLNLRGGRFPQNNFGQTRLNEESAYMMPGLGSQNQTSTGFYQHAGMDSAQQTIAHDNLNSMADFDDDRMTESIEESNSPNKRNRVLQSRVKTENNSQGNFFESP